MLGLGLGLNKGTNGLTTYQKLLKSATWAIDFSRPQGTVFPTLAPRTLPNGVSNGAYLKNVSDDVIQNSDVSILSTVASNFVDIHAITTKLNKFISADPNSFVMDSVPRISTPAYFNNETDLQFLGKVYCSTSSPNVIRIVVAKGQTLATTQLQLVGLILSYQLATPIDTLNSGQINPVYDLVGNADVTLNQVGWTSADGYATALAPNGKTVVGLQADKLNTYGVGASNMPNPQGTQDFAFALSFKTGASIDGYYFHRGNGGVTAQYAMYVYSDGKLEIAIQNTGIIVSSAGAILPNTFNKLIFLRVGGALKVYLNGALIYNQANTTALVSASYFRLFCRANSADGSIQATYSAPLLLEALYTDKDFTKFETEFNKYCATEYGL